MVKTVPLPTDEMDTYSNRVFGFWVYLMTDSVLFSMLFATFVVLRSGTFGGPSGSELFELPFTFGQTCALLISSFLCGIAMLAIKRGKRVAGFVWFIFTFLFGATFVGMELYEFGSYLRAGHSWESSAFLSSFFTLVGTHGLHVTIGLIWLVILMIQLLRWGITTMTFRRLVYFNMFWHFLDLVWIFIFTIVYLTAELV